MNRAWSGTIGGRKVAGSDVLASYWRLAAERQRVYHARLAGEPAPWTDDEVVSQYRFTNAYRAADRVSQDLIRVIYTGSQDPDDVLLRILLYRFFNKPQTWQAIEGTLGEVTAADFDMEACGAILDQALAQGQRIYSAAYIVPPPPFGHQRKHRNHLALIETMISGGLGQSLQQAASLQNVFHLLLAYPSLGPFLAFQLTIDLNYSTLIDFDEDDFVVAGPGALSGLAKCFPDARGIPASDLIRWMADTQEQQLARYEIDFQDLFGRRLKLIDCQNLFCETDKYARVAHPDVTGVGNRTRIKQQFTANGPLEAPRFPPKWGLDPMPSPAAANAD
jgi:alpha-glutamyl/putrescinyl thymine pyrophosphorylase clade 1